MIKKYHIKIALIIGVLFVGYLFLPEKDITESTKPVGAIPPILTVNEIRNNLIQEQVDNFNTTGKYKHIPKQMRNGKEITVNEYQAPTGNGYQIVITEQVGNVITSRATATGPEAQHRTWVRINIIENKIASST
ncbi:hypothetical protein LCGC14_1260510 [marine sediment metagenome]|uniref:Uncharacterized protein n=1 Tax=marine sediment metagenome TaxID=412755 RepID=A0A0F9NHK7_9ZZZZ